MKVFCKVMSGTCPCQKYVILALILLFQGFINGIHWSMIRGASGCCGVEAALLLQFMICHSKSDIGPAPQDVIKARRWNNIHVEAASCIYSSAYWLVGSGS
jgi:hypothetical protein